MATTKTTAVTTAPQGGAVQAADFESYKKNLTEKVLARITGLAKNGISLPSGFKAENEIRLAFLQLAQMETRDRKPLLSVVTPASVANAMLEMCIKGLSLYKKQCAFIQYGDTVTLQPEYHGNIAMAKRYGAGDPQAQVIYADDDFEYEINPATGKKRVLKHVQKLANIDKSKIVGAWALVPYANDPTADPKVEVMTMAEIKQSWMQGATKGESPAHRNFPAEMCKKTVINKAIKLFISTGEDGTTEAPEYQEAEIIEHTSANAQEATFTELPPAPSAASVQAAAEDPIDLETGEVKEPAPEPVKVAPAPADDMPNDFFTA